MVYLLSLEKKIDMPNSHENRLRRQAVEESLADTEDLSSNTKAQIKELADSISVSVNMSSTKATMIATLTSSSEYFVREESRKHSLFLDKMVKVEKEILKLRSENV